ncbi:OmpA family protein [Tabrizicola piscis]|uniref:OmpA family protein n=1 Tax=Tabrizicola piscis TaxID=2494374 RepID=A0A3S8U7R0_9RHOB|nr:OmpA family protein [Tabrizicola piscis]AZL59607.1 OmpA family protein [Tabrizicola piscis]
MLPKGLFLAAILLGSSAVSGGAQTLTDDEILDRFLTQREAYTAVRTGKGATRGLTIVTVETPDATAPAVDVVDGGPVLGDAPEDDTSTVVVAGTETAPATGDGTVSLTEVAADAAPAVDASKVGLLPEDLQVNVSISFDYDSATIKADQRPVLDQMCRVMRASDIKLFRIMGHTDAAGSDIYNEKLSLLRAEEVKRRLISDCGIEPTRLDAMGLGERFPADSADPRAPENRRVEFQALS